MTAGVKAKSASAVITAVIVVIIVLATHIDASSAISNTNANRADSGKIRIGLIESERFDTFGYYLNGIAEGLLKIGVIHGYDVYNGESDTRIMWNALSECESEDFIFVKDCFYTMKEMTEEKYAAFIGSENIDLWFVLGTSAGIYMTEHEDKVDYMVFASQNPIAAGIVKSETERIKSNSYAYVDLDRIARQIEVGYNIFKFEKIGVVYENNPGAYAYSGVETLYRKASEHGFEVCEKHVAESLNESDDSRYYGELKAAYSELIDEGIDALYITVATIAPEKLPWLLEDVKKAGIATISQGGESELTYGAILGVSQSDYQDEGRYIAELLKKYADGASIENLEQVYKIVPKISLNYDALTESGLKLPVKVLLSFDEIIRAK